MKEPSSIAEERLELVDFKYDPPFPLNTSKDLILSRSLLRQSIN